MNHPIHIINREKEMSPSAFIPFCEFGGDMSALGVKIGQFDVPVCNSFQAKIFHDQLCYEVDLNKFANKIKINKKEMKIGLTFLMDYNEDRQVKFEVPAKEKKEEIDLDMSRNILKLDHNDDAVIHFNSIGRNM